MGDVFLSRLVKEIMYIHGYRIEVRLEVSTA